ncbi:deoxyribonuclease-1-like 1 [Dicentrarchus labrax]|uniref:Deoxyribonuclease-1-like 1 n=1 Tax=Dicentrarchus labrax TaxID=13489 RepID=A0A8C4HXR8_DICLA|nr:deoxyribonuclease-1-like 1 [Dicentrarchus labrax]
MRSSSLLLLSFLVGVCDIQGALGFRICAFNLHHFGDSKSKKSDVMQTLTRIIARCDVCLLQEVRDSKEKALPQLLDSLNRYDTDHVYDAVASERLGRSESYKEQYVFVYRTGAVTVTGEYQYPDDLPGDVDAFSREPFVVRFKAPKTVIKEFVLIPQHTTPTNTTKELDALYDVLQRVRKMWKTENVMLLGDFNADCGYLAKKNRKHVRLITERNLYWLIPDKTDTTVRAATSCAYDRIVVHGESFDRAIVPSSAKPFNFQMEYQLTEEQALEVSDHYPVEVLLKDLPKVTSNGASSLTLTGTQETANQKTTQSKFLSLFVASHLALQMLTQ